MGVLESARKTQGASTNNESRNIYSNDSPVRGKRSAEKDANNEMITTTELSLEKTSTVSPDTTTTHSTDVTGTSSIKETDASLLTGKIVEPSGKNATQNSTKNRSSKKIANTTVKEATNHMTNIHSSQSTTTSLEPTVSSIQATSIPTPIDNDVPSSSPKSDLDLSSSTDDSTLDDFNVGLPLDEIIAPENENIKDIIDDLNVRLPLDEILMPENESIKDVTTDDFGVGLPFDEIIMPENESNKDLTTDDFDVDSPLDDIIMSENIEDTDALLGKVITDIVKGDEPTDLGDLMEQIVTDSTENYKPAALEVSLDTTPDSMAVEESASAENKIRSSAIPYEDYDYRLYDDDNIACILASMNVTLKVPFVTADNKVHHKKIQLFSIFM